MAPADPAAAHLGRSRRSLRRPATFAPAFGVSDDELSRVSRALSTLVLLTGLVVVVGWIAQVRSVVQIAPGLATMKINTAVCLMVLAASFLWVRVRIVAGTVVALTAGATILEYATSTSFGIDQFLVADHYTTGTLPPGRPSLATAICLMLLAACRLVPVRHARRERRLVELSASTVLVLSGLAILGYAYGVQSLYRVGLFSTVAVHTAGALAALCIVQLAGLPATSLRRLLTGTRPGAVLLRRLAPVCLVGLPVLGYLCVLGEHRGWFDLEFGLVVAIACAVVLLTVVALRAAGAIDRIDVDRRNAADALSRLNEELTERVNDQAAAVVHQERRVAVLEDRDRIAADLHDRVIQRLFAVGIQLDTAAGRPPGSASPDRLRDAVLDIDDCIVELRSTIRDIHANRFVRSVADDLTEIVARAQDLLGHPVEFLVDGDLAALEPSVQTHLPAVLQEALTNVVRHAGATCATVAVTVGGELTLTVTDDGVGFDVARPRASGTANIARRAEQLQGRATWTTQRSGGTRLDWVVPVAARVPPESRT